MDTGLVVRAQRGDEAAFAAITSAVYGRLLQVAYRILRDPLLAEDATQRAMVRIWHKLPRLRDPSRFEAWSYRFLVNACADEARRERRTLTQTLIDVDVPVPDDVGRIDDHDMLERAFEALSIDHRAVIVLHHYLDLTLDATAEALGISPGTAKSRLNRAMTRLREAMRAEAPHRPHAAPEVAR